MTRMRMLGLLLTILVVIVGALGTIPSGLASRMNGVGGSGHLTADGVLGVGVLLVLGGLVAVLSREPASLASGTATPQTAIPQTATAPPPMAQGSQTSATESSGQEALPPGSAPPAASAAPVEQITVVAAEEVVTALPPEAMPAAPPMAEEPTPLQEEQEKHESP
jgi:hypothetical protein